MRASRIRASNRPVLIKVADGNPTRFTAARLDRAVRILERSYRCIGHHLFFFSSRRRHTRFDCDWSSDVCSSDLLSGGHHDAGDYSKYTINSAALIHYLVFAVDAFEGVGELDNLGIPESGDGKSDLLDRKSVV